MSLPSTTTLKTTTSSTTQKQTSTVSQTINVQPKTTTQKIPLTQAEEITSLETTKRSIKQKPTTTVIFLTDERSTTRKPVHKSSDVTTLPSVSHIDKNKATKHSEPTTKLTTDEKEPKSTTDYSADDLSSVIYLSKVGTSTKYLIKSTTERSKENLPKATKTLSTKYIHKATTQTSSKFISKITTNLSTRYLPIMTTNSSSKYVPEVTQKSFTAYQPTKTTENTAKVAQEQSTTLSRIRNEIPTDILPDPVSVSLNPSLTEIPRRTSLKTLDYRSVNAQVTHASTQSLISRHPQSLFDTTYDTKRTTKSTVVERKPTTLRPKSTSVIENETPTDDVTYKTTKITVVKRKPTTVRRKSTSRIENKIPTDYITYKTGKRNELTTLKPFDPSRRGELKTGQIGTRGPGMFPFMIAWTSSCSTIKVKPPAIYRLYTIPFYDNLLNFLPTISCSIAIGQ